MAYIYDLTDTWSAAGTVFNGIKLNVTNTASAAASKLVTLQIGGTEHFSVTKDGVGYFSGNVGIGTSSPSSFGGYTSLTVNNATNGGLIEATNGTRTIRMQSQASGSALIGTTTSHNLGIMSAGVERVTVDTSGNVGIGTSSVAGRLHSVSTSGFTAPTLLCGDGVGTFRVVFNTGAYAGVPANKPWLHSYDDIYLGSDAATAFNVMSAGTNTFKVTSAGNVGIGTTAPGAKFDVNGGSANTEVRFNYADNTVGRTVTLRMASTSNPSYTGAGAYVQAIQGAGVDVYSLAFGTTQGSTSATERMRIDASGNLLLGTTSNTYGSRCVFASNGGSNIMETRQTGTGNQYHAIFINANGGVGSITTDGSATQFVTSSDVRLKDNITDADDASSLIDAIQVRKFDWKADGSHQRYGFVAQELVTVAPEAVSQPENPEEMMGVDYSKLVPMLVKEIQSLRARVAQLEGN